MSENGKKSRKFFYDGDVSLSDFANSTAVQRQHCRKGRSSFNVVCKEVACVGAVNAAATLKGGFGVDPGGVPLASVANSASVKSGKLGNSAIVKSGEPGNSANVKSEEPGNASTVKSGNPENSTAVEKGKSRNLAVVKKGKRVKAQRSLDLVLRSKFNNALAGIFVLHKPNDGIDSQPKKSLLEESVLNSAIVKSGKPENSATVKSEKNGNPANEKLGEPGNSSTVKSGKPGNSAAVKSGRPGNSAAVEKGKPRNSADVKKRKPGKAELSIDLVHRVQNVNTKDLAWDEQSEDEDLEDIFNHVKKHNDDRKGVKKVNKEDLPWDEQSEDEESDEEDVAWYKSDDEDCEDFHYAKDDQSIKGKKIQVDAVAKKEELDQNRLRNDLLIRGLKEKLGEDTKAQVVDMCRKRLKRNITTEDIVQAQRLGKLKPPGQNRIILVTFKSYSDRKRVFNIKRKLKSSGVMITEHLTPQRQELFHIVRNQFGEKKSWTQDGTVFWIDDCGNRCSAKRKADLTFSYLGL